MVSLEVLTLKSLFTMKNQFNRKVYSLLLFLGLALCTGCFRKTVITPLSCTTDALKVTESATKYLNEPSKANCEAYKKNVIDFLKSCPTYYTGATRQDLDDFAAQPCD